MTRSRFANANGLGAPEQVSTARDLGRLAATVLRDYPDYAGLWSMPAVSIGKRRLPSHNALLTKYAGTDGMKTGFICDAGYNVVASATRNGHKLIAVVLGETSYMGRFHRAANLLEHGFRKHDWTQLFAVPSLDTLPMAENALAPPSMRPLVCNTAPADAATKDKTRAHVQAPGDRWSPW